MSSPSQYMAITYIDPRYNVSYTKGGTYISINQSVSDTSGWLIDTSGTLDFSFNLVNSNSIPSSDVNVIEYIIFNSGVFGEGIIPNGVVPIDTNNIYTSGLLTKGEYILRYNAANSPPQILSIESLYSSFIKIKLSQVGITPIAYRFTLVDVTDVNSQRNVYTYPDVPIGAVTLDSVVGNATVYSYILPTPPFGTFSISIGALFGPTLDPINEATFLIPPGQAIITGKSAVFSIGELLAYQAETPLVETQKARLEPPLHVVGNKNLRAHSDLVRLNTIEMQTENTRQKVLQEPYNNINFGSYSDYISSKVGRLQRNYAL